MASVLNELKKHGHYSTKSEDENQEAQDLLDSGMVNISNGGSTTVDGKSIAILNCTTTKKFDELKKKKKI